VLNLDVIQEAFASVEKISQREVTFLIGDLPITMRHITDAEEVEILKYASLALEEGAEDQGTQQEFIHRMKVATLSFAIVQIGEVSFREDLVDTGKKLPKSDQPLLMERAQVTRGLLAKWPKPYLTRSFAKYGELTTKVELEAERSIVYDPVDFDAEIARLQARIKEMEEGKKRQEEARLDDAGKKVRDVILDANQEQIQRSSQEATESLVTSSPEKPPQPQEPEPQEPETPQQSEVSPQEIPPPLQDQEALLQQKQAQIAAHNAQILEAREVHKQIGAASHPSAPPIRRRPPHAGAMEVSQGLDRPTMIGTKRAGGKEVDVYALPPQTLSPRRGQNTPDDLVLDPKSSQAAINPNFVDPFKPRG
jgi:hypothetical protein